MNDVLKMESAYKKMNNLAAYVYSNMLFNSEEGDKAYTYLLNRGFTRETMEMYELGYAPNGKMLLNVLKSQGFDVNDILKNDLIKENTKNGNYFETFQDRIVFPIRNEYGEILGFGGRILPGDKSPVKYLNTGETPIFHKRNHLYNLDFAKTAIQEMNYAILLEGYFDSIAATQHGIKNVVASMGTSLTDTQIDKLKQLTNQIVVCYDSDKAGVNATQRNCEMLLDKEFEVRIAIMPEGFDPHDYITTYGVKAFNEEILMKTKSYISFYKEYVKQDKNILLEVDGLNYINEVFEKFSRDISDKEKSKIFKELISEMNISAELLKDTFNQEI